MGGHGAPSRIWPIEGEMALLEVFPDQLTLIDKKNIEKAREGRRWYLNCGYPRSNVLKCFLHQHILEWIGNGYYAIQTDHIDRNPLNNLESNLRLTTRSENGFNSGLWKHNTSGIKGVFWNRTEEKWYAKITVNGRQEFLGSFDKIEEAARARREAEERLREFREESYGRNTKGSCQSQHDHRDGPQD